MVPIPSIPSIRPSGSSSMTCSRCRLRFPIVLLLALAGQGHLLPSSAVAKPLARGIFGADDRIPADSHRWPWQAIGIVQRRIGGACTGTLIAPRVVLTAAHCTFDQRNGQPLQPSDLRFLASGRPRQNPQTPPPAGIAGIVRTTPGHGQRNPTIRDMATDWALLVLRAPLPYRPIPLQSRRLPDGQTMARAGFSEGDRLTLVPACRILHRDPAERFWFTDCDTLAGDSGSPVLAGHGNAVVVVGVTSGVITDDRGRAGSVVVPVSRFLARIRDLRIPGTNRPILPPGAGPDLSPPPASREPVPEGQGKPLRR